MILADRLRELADRLEGKNGAPYPDCHACRLGLSAEPPYPEHAIGCPERIPSALELELVGTVRESATELERLEELTESFGANGRG